MVDRGHRLVKLSQRIAWEGFEEKFGGIYCLDNGRPRLKTRLMVGLTYLKYLHDSSDREVIEHWVENPYVDTTVQEKNISYPSEAKLLVKAVRKLVSLSKESGVNLRQAYTWVGKRHLVMAHRYAAAQQWNRARRETRKLRTILRRTIRDIERKATDAQRALFEPLLVLSRKVLHMVDGGEKVYSLHEPHTECIAKGKMHKRFEFGVKVSVVQTRTKGFVLDCRAVHGNPFDGHTLATALSNVERLLGAPLKSSIVGVDLGYRGHGIKERFRVLHPRLKRLGRTAKLFVRARSKIEATISLMKRCYRLGRNYLQGVLGDQLNALFVGAAHNFGIYLRASTG